MVVGSLVGPLVVSGIAQVTVFWGLLVRVLVVFVSTVRGFLIKIDAFLRAFVVPVLVAVVADVILVLVSAGTLVVCGVFVVIVFIVLVVFIVFIVFIVAVVIVGTGFTLVVVVVVVTADAVAMVAGRYVVVPPIVVFIVVLIVVSIVVSIVAFVVVFVFPIGFCVAVFVRCRVGVVGCFDSFSFERSTSRSSFSLPPARRFGVGRSKKVFGFAGLVVG